METEAVNLVLDAELVQAFCSNVEIALVANCILLALLLGSVLGLVLAQYLRH